MWNVSFSYSIIQRGNAGGRQKKASFSVLSFWAWGLCGPAERQRGLMQTEDCKWDTKICIHTPIHYRKLGGETEYSSASSLYFLSSAVSFFFDFQFHPSVLIAQKVISCLCLSGLLPPLLCPLLPTLLFSLFFPFLFHFALLSVISFLLQTAQSIPPTLGSGLGLRREGGLQWMSIPVVSEVTAAQRSHWRRHRTPQFVHAGMCDIVEVQSDRNSLRRIPTSTAHT